MSHPGLAATSIALGGEDASGRCGNEFGSLREMILWMLRHHKHPNPPDPDPWITNLTTIAEGLQKVAIATTVTDAKMRTSIAMEGIKGAQAGLKGLETGMR